MYSTFELAWKYLKYYITSSNGKGHGVHSPFVFDFIVKVLNDRRQFYPYEAIESLRERLLHDATLLDIEDFGAGSAIQATKQRSIASIARNAAKNRKLSQLLFRIVHYYQPKEIIELGTSLGISSAYMATAAPNAKVFTLEGAKAVADVAKRNHDALQIDNIEVLPGRFDDLLPSVLTNMTSVDLAFVDGNHRLIPTLKYFELLSTKATNDSIFLFDDIHWSREMEQAWKTIREHPSVRATIDLFFIGIVVFRDAFKSKQHFTIRF